MAPNVIPQALSNMAASKTSIISTAASLAASAVLLRTIANDLLPQNLRHHLASALAGLLHRHSSKFTVIIEEYEGIAVNQLYSSAEVYLGSISSPTTRRVRAGKSKKESSITIVAEHGQEIIDVFDGIRLKWMLIHNEMVNRTMYTSHDDYGSSTIRTQIRYFRLVFDKSHKSKVFSSYLPYMMEKAKVMKEAKKGLKLHMLKQEEHYYPGRSGTWTSVNFDHPATFETLAMEPDVKRSLIDDLERFVAGKEYYRKVGKAWKRGYLLYGPPGTGKSSLIAAIANHLNYNVYDLELADLRSNSHLRKLLLSTENRSILVVEDIDCTIDLTKQQAEEEQAATTSGRRSGRKTNQDYRVSFEYYAVF